MRKVYGVGVNDSKTPVSVYKDGRQTKKPVYAIWAGMLKRCYADSYKKDRPTYSDCTVCEEWHLYSRFEKWMIAQDWVGKQLDKDVIKPGNNVYSPDTCCFVDAEVNGLIKSPFKGNLPPGVSLHKDGGSYEAKISIENKQHRIGFYKTIDDAAKAYAKAKSDRIAEVAMRQSDERIKNGLLRHAKAYRSLI